MAQSAHEAAVSSVRDTCADQPGIELRLARLAVTGHGDFEVRLQEKLLHVEVDAPVLVELVVEPDLQRGAEGVLDLEIIGAAGLDKGSYSSRRRRHRA